ncbi:MAG: homoserine kinase [Planctomycetes bacterium]|jgi:homoserine kinase|nr:homoserine kinase [Planctomycetota bacterium]
MGDWAAMQNLLVTVPASSSNLGPGFDCLGLCLDLMLEVTLVGPAAGKYHEFVGLEKEAHSWPTAPKTPPGTVQQGESRTNSFLIAFDRALEQFGVPLAPFSFAVTSEIPLGRGLGSSGAAVAAGLVLAAEVAGRPQGTSLRRDLVSLGAEIEGHPDNSTASLYGGCTLALATESGWNVLQPPVAESIGIALAWGSTPLATSEARLALPETVNFPEAADQPRRLAFLLEGLRSGDGDLLTLGGVDHLHEAFRLPLIPGGAEAQEAGQNAGAWSVTLSGAGSGMLALSPLERAEDVALAMGTVLEEQDGPALHRVARVCREGAALSRL